MDYCRLSGSSVHGILLARILERVAASFFRESSPPRDQTLIPCTGRHSLLLSHQGSLTVEYSVQVSRSVVSNSLRPHESQHARPPCPSPTPGVHSDSRPSSQWYHPAISSSVVPFSSCPQSLPASESFPMSQLFAWGGQSTGVSALASFLPKKSQGWSPIAMQRRNCNDICLNRSPQLFGFHVKYFVFIYLELNKVLTY